MSENVAPWSVERCHCCAGAGYPDADAVNEYGAPLATVCDVGSAVTAGADGGGCTTALNVLPGPGITRFSAVVARPQFARFGIVYVLENVEAPLRFAVPAMVTLTGVDVVQLSPTTFTVGVALGY